MSDAPESLEEALRLSVEARACPVRVYVAGSSRELGRVRTAIRAIRRLFGDEAIHHDWTETIEVERERHRPAHLAVVADDRHVDNEQARAAAKTMLEAILDADVVWLLASPRNHGALVELGYVIGMREHRVVEPRLIVSGESSRSTVFARLADEVHDTDTPALFAIARWARERAQARADDGQKETA